MLTRVENTCAFYARFYPFEKKWKGIPNAEKYTYIGTH